MSLKSKLKRALRLTTPGIPEAQRDVLTLGQLREEGDPTWKDTRYQLKSAFPTVPGGSPISTEAVARDAPVAGTVVGAFFGYPQLGTAIGQLVGAGAKAQLARKQAEQQQREEEAARMSMMDGNGWASVVGRLGEAYLNYRAGSSSRPGVGYMQTMGALPPILGRSLPAIGGAVARGAGSAMRGAVTWCRRNPAWCSTVGGTAAVAAMIESGQLPMPRRRRGRGLSARDLRGFRRTVRLIRATASSVGIRGRGRARGAAAPAGTFIAQN